MTSLEAKQEALTQEFIQATQDLHSEGMPWLLIDDVRKQMARNDEALMRRHEIASKVLGIVCIQLSEPRKRGQLYTIADNLFNQGRLERTNAERDPKTGHWPMLVQIIENPDCPVATQGRSTVPLFD